MPIDTLVEIITLQEEGTTVHVNLEENLPKVGKEVFQH